MIVFKKLCTNNESVVMANILKTWKSLKIFKIWSHINGTKNIERKKGANERNSIPRFTERKNCFLLRDRRKRYIYSRQKILEIKKSIIKNIIKNWKYNDSTLQIIIEITLNTTHICINKCIFFEIGLFISSSMFSYFFLL